MLAHLPLWLAIFLFSTTCHEAAHAWVARLLGDSTAHAGGQVTLDPTPHVRRHPVGMLVVPILSFVLNGGRWMIGWASAPYDPVWASRFPRRAAYMAAAGPAANLVLVLVAAALIHSGIQAGFLQSPHAPSTDRIVELVGGDPNLGTLALSILFSLNLLLLTFNLIPLPPLDGNGALGLFLPADLQQKWQRLFDEPVFALVGLVVAWQLFAQVWPFIFLGALRVLYPEAAYVAG